MSDSATEAGKDVVRRHGERIEIMARIGYGARAIVYLIIGGFAIRAALASGQPIGTSGAIRTLFGAPFGVFLLYAMSLALLGFALWRVVYALMDPDRRGSGWKGWTIRLASLAAAGIYGALAFSTGRLALGLSVSDGAGAPESLVREAFEAGFGLWLTFAAAALLAVVGAVHLGRAFKASFERTMTLPPRTLPWLKWICQFGLVARGLVFLVVGWLLVSGAASLTREATPGTEDALQAVIDWDHGHLILGLLGAGLLAFAVFGFAQAWLRRIDIENS